MTSKYRRSMSISLGALAFWGIFCLIVLVGWCINIYELSQMDNVINHGEGILRIAGIFLPPLGAVMGYFF